MRGLSLGLGLQAPAVVAEGGGGGGPTGVSLVGSDQGSIPASTTADLTYPAGTQNGDFILVFLAADSSGWTAPSGYSVIASETIGLPSYYIMSKFVSGETSTGTIGANSNKCPYGIISLRGVNATTPTVMDAGQTTGSGDTITPPSVTTTLDGAWIFACAFLDDDGSTFTPPSGYTEVIDIASTLGGTTVDASIGVSYLEQGTAGTESPGNYVASSSDAWRGRTFAVNPA